jgi:hypothetical protein
MSALAAGRATAAEDAGLAFVLGPGSHLMLGTEQVPLPDGSRLELAVDGQKSGGRFAVKLSPGGLVMPAIDLGKEGQQVRVRIQEAGSGWLTPSADGLALDLAATVEVELTDGAEVRTDAYELVLTTAAAASEAGQKVDRGSRTAQLVASGTVAADSPVAPGEPLLVVLGGSFEGLPADLR